MASVFAKCDTLVLDGYNTFTRNNPHQFTDIIKACNMGWLPEKHLIVVKSSLIDYPLDMEDSTEYTKQHYITLLKHFPYGLQ